MKKNVEMNFDLDELLQLKRSEKPEEAFWDTFEQTIHMRIAQEQVKPAWNFSSLWRSILRPIQFASLGLAALAIGGMFYLSDRDSKKNFMSVAMIQRNSLTNSVLKITNSSNSVLAKNLIHGSKKMIAMNGIERFSY